MNESEKQFSFTRAAPSTSGRAKNQIPISKIEQDIRNQPSRGTQRKMKSAVDRAALAEPSASANHGSGEIRWKHAMHLLRLLITSAATLREARVPVRVETHRERLLAVKRGELPWPAVNAWRRELHRDFECALAGTKLSERPDYEAANRFLIKARRKVVRNS
jgi:hypothetical protein